MVLIAQTLSKNTWIRVLTNINFDWISIDRERDILPGESTTESKNIALKLDDGAGAKILQNNTVILCSNPHF